MFLTPHLTLLLLICAAWLISSICSPSLLSEVHILSTPYPQFISSIRPPPLPSAAHILPIPYPQLEVDPTIGSRLSSANRITLSHTMPYLLTISPHYERNRLSCPLILFLLWPMNVNRHDMNRSINVLSSFIFCFSSLVAFYEGKN